jgi:hypothetical protein
MIEFLNDVEGRGDNDDYQGRELSLPTPKSGLEVE